jgi:membrane protease YdiL (CAAX protease family)
MDEREVRPVLRSVIPVEDKAPLLLREAETARGAPPWAGLAVAIPAGAALALGLFALSASLTSEVDFEVAPAQVSPVVQWALIAYVVLIFFGSIVLVKRFLRLVAGVDRLDPSIAPWGIPFALAVCVALLIGPELMLLAVTGRTDFKRWIDTDFAGFIYATSAFKFGTAVLALACARRFYRGAGRALGLAFSRLARGIAGGALALSAALPLVFLGTIAAFAAFGRPRQEIAVEMSETLSDPATGLPAKALMVFAAVALVPFAEEVVFRVFLQGGLRATFSRLLDPRLRWTDLPPGRGPLPPPRLAAWTAIFVTAAIFAAMHTLGGEGQVGVVLPLFGLAIVLGYAYEMTHSIAVAWTMHAAFNGGSILLMALATGGGGG